MCVYNSLALIKNHNKKCGHNLHTHGYRKFGFAE